MRETENLVLFWRHQFGQWTLREIIDPDGMSFNCCEQYMMFKKASLFNDDALAEQIMMESEPARQQELGREVRHFHQHIWRQHRIGIVWYANFLKFSQHQDLKQRLLNTGDKVLAEASPYDRIWGIGLAAEDDLALNQENWLGLNLLGEALMSVRTALRIPNSQPV